MTLPRPSSFFDRWAMDPEVCFLNHGSFGATPRAVLAQQTAWRERLESEPIRFFIEEHQGIMDDVRRAIAAFVRCPWDSLALLPNASISVATVMDNLRLAPGDEILINDQEYPACQNSARRAAARAGAAVKYAPIPFPCPSPDSVVEAYLSKVTPRTRLALVSHVTSPTAMIFPVERLVKELQSRGVDVLVDGAHAAGMVPRLNIAELGPAYYTCNCHKWVCSPKGSAFLHVRPDRQQGFRPLTLSNNAEKPKPSRSQFLTEFDFIGTQDYTSIYSVPKAIDVMGSMVSGWPEVMSRNHDLCLKGRRLLCAALGIEPPAPDGMIGSIATIILPAHPPDLHARLMARPTRYHDALQDNLLARHRIQVPVWGLAGKPGRFLRISAQLYNSVEQYQYLAAALKDEIAAEGRL